MFPCGWANFRTRTYYYQGSPWDSSAFTATRWGAGADRLQRARVTLPEVLVPRQATIRGLNCPITALPYVWCFIRARHIRAIAEQSTVVPRVAEYGGVSMHGSSSNPPSWINSGTTVRFLLGLGSARVPGECQFITLSTDASVIVEIEDVIGSALPELCFLLPSGNLLDFAEYDDNIPLPDECPSDEWAGVHATVRIQLLDNSAEEVTNVYNTEGDNARKRLRR